MSRQISIKDQLYKEIMIDKPAKMSFSKYFELMRRESDPMRDLIAESYGSIESVLMARYKYREVDPNNPIKHLISVQRALILKLYNDPVLSELDLDAICLECEHALMNAVQQIKTVHDMLEGDTFERLKIRM